MTDPCNDPQKYAPTEEDLIREFQRLSAVASGKRKALDLALRDLIEAERAAERAGCAIDEARRT